MAARNSGMVGFWVALGVAAGAAMGVLTGNLPLWIVLGIGAGILIGMLAAGSSPK